MAKKALFKTAIVEKRNVLNELRSNNMNLQELRFFSIYLSKINPHDLSTRLVRFPISDFQRIMEFGRLNIKQLKASTDSLMTKIVHVPTEHGGYTAFQLFKECRVDQDTETGEWFVEIDAHDKALPLMFDFKNRYFKYELWNALRLKSPNQVRMYEILKQYEGLGKRELTVTELRELLGIAPDEYAGRTGWSDFKKYVLDSCQQALAEFTDIKYTYERGQVGKGGKWLSIIFHIEKNSDYVDKLSLDEFISLQPDPGSILLDTDEAQGTKESGKTTADNRANVRDWVAIYGSERLARLAEACDYEFGRVDMEAIAACLPSTLSDDTAAFEYLHVLYTRMCTYAQKHAILSRSGYLQAMARKEPVKTRDEPKKGSKTGSKRPMTQREIDMMNDCLSFVNRFDVDDL